MDTSKSTDPNGATAMLLVFSGRPNPVWQLTPEILRELKKIWKSAIPLPNDSPPMSRLGYSGCLIQQGEEVWMVAFGKIRLTRSGRSETRLDEKREFERRILLSAPLEWLPLVSQILESDF